jgi:uncharacterized protein YdeI (YjbR/CyaY-like superfamily)
MATGDDLELIAFASKADFRAWMEEHHATKDGVWVQMAKAKTGIPTVTWSDIVEVALCFGWIDGQAKGIDETWHKQRVTPRRKRSTWSKVNVEKVARLIEAGEMTPAGLAEIERAKADGRWAAAYDPPSRATVPADLQAALDANPQAKDNFGKLDGQNRYAILHRIQDAKKPETRARRIEKFVAMCAAGERLHR